MIYLHKTTRDYLQVLQQIALSLRYSDAARSMLIVVLVATVGGSLALQGWKSRTPAFDLLLATEGAFEFVLDQRIPDRGALASFAAYNPPGGAWLMIPGVFLFTDPRLYEFVGSLTVYIGTLLGVLLLARTCFDMRCATLAVVLYGLSELGLLVAGSVWDRLALHFFYVWMTYWIVQWVTERNAKYLVAAIVTLATGLYVFMEMAPALFILPIAWIVYRPPMKLQPLVFGGLLILVLWTPYIKLEFARNFADLRSLALQEKILPADYKNSWCDPQLILHSSGISHIPNIADRPQNGADTISVLNRLSPVLERAKFIIIALISNFQHSAHIPGGSIVLTIAVLSCLFLLTLSGISAATANRITDRIGFWLPGFAIGIIVSGVVANELIIARYLSIDGILESTTVSTIRRLQLILVLSGLALLILRKPTARISNQVVTRMAGSNRTAQHSVNVMLLAISLVIPWVILLLIVENIQHLERFWWLWPIQVVVLAAFVTHIPSRLQMPRIVVWIGSFLLISMILSNTLTLSRIEEWSKNGWSGADSDQIRVIEYLAILLEGKDRAAIGYQMPIYRFTAIFNAVDPRYKAGADWDMFFKYRHGISNTNRCAEGFSPNDEFRIVQTRSSWTTAQGGLGYFDVSLDRKFHLLQQFGSYQLFKRE